MKTFWLILLPFVLLASVACDDDPARPIINGHSEYKNLTQRSDVLFNLQLSYNNRNLARYEALLDENLTFFLSAGDVGGGLPPSWDRATEVTIHTRLFDPNHSGPGPKCTGILLNIEFEDGVTWMELDAPTVPAEKWYVATLFYDFKFEMDPDTHYLNNPGAKAQFTVRNAGTDDAPKWQLVELRDIGDPGFVAGSSSATESSTWGQVKALYR